MNVKGGKMKTGLRGALVACSAAAALAFVGSALAAYTPHLTVSHTPLALGGGGSTDITVSFDQSDDATAKATIYVPQGYTGTLTAAPGAQVGTIDASILASAISPTQPLPLKGTIQADDPAKYTSSGLLCTGSATHDAVWLLRLQAAGTELAVPGYLDAVKAKVKKKLATLSGALRVGSAGLAGMKVTLLSGTSRTKLKASGSATTRSGGAYSFKKRLRKATYFRARVTAAARSTTCTGGVPGIPCASATLNPFTVQSAIVKATPKRR